MKPEQNISNNNKEAYKDILAAMFIKRNGVFHFEIRLSNGNIADFVVREYTTYEPTKQK